MCTWPQTEGAEMLLCIQYTVYTVVISSSTHPDARAQLINWTFIFHKTSLEKNWKKLAGDLAYNHKDKYILVSVLHKD